ncbi:diguanylate cyclase [Pseudomonas capeferrum]|nr:diguanylate cyclase [Pseudomonas capeferrum]
MPSFRLSAVRTTHFLPSLCLLCLGVAAVHVNDLSVFFTSLFNVLPTLILLLGSAYCAVYRRQRELFLMITVYIAYYLLGTQADFYREHGQVREDGAVVFHLVCLLLPGLFGLHGAWQKQTHLARDMLARVAVLFAVGGVALALEQRYPEVLLAWLADIRWPALHGQWMSLIQLAYPLYVGLFILLSIQNLRQSRPLHAAQLVGSLGIFWMLPKTFILPFTLNIICSQVMLMIAAAVSQEAYQMVFRDELTGLPGRRALNERLQCLGRTYVLAMTDVDHFKKFNDTHGHDVGDQVPRLVASKLSKVSGGGRANRHGMERFAWRDRTKLRGRMMTLCLVKVVRVHSRNHRAAIRRNRVPPN